MREFDPSKDTYPLPEVTSYAENAKPLSTFYTRDSEGDRAFEEGVEYGMRYVKDSLHSAARYVIVAWHHDLPPDAPHLHHAVTALARALDDPFYENRPALGRPVDESWSSLDMGSAGDRGVRGWPRMLGIAVYGLMIAVMVTIIVGLVIAMALRP